MKKRTVLIVIMFMLLWFGLNLFDSKNSTFNSVIVAVIDTGLNIDDTIDKNRIIYVDDSIDDIGHGTQIVQLIQNNTNDCVSIMPIKVVDSNGSASWKQSYPETKKQFTGKYKRIIKQFRIYFMESMKWIV